MKPVSAEHAALCQQKYDMLIEPLRAQARELGYALAVHGSLRRDIDLIAVPWSEAAVPPIELAQAIRATAELVNGVAFCRDRQWADAPEYFDRGCPGAKPHGRLVWSFHLGGGPYIDLSVMTPMADPRGGP